MKDITIIDYGMGNIQSLHNSIKFLGYNPVFYSDTKKINTNICILPGVGALNHAMNLINKKNIFNHINNFTNKKDNLLIGICLGMQLFFEESTENTITSGLGIIKGSVKKLSINNYDILPNVGWFKTHIEPNNYFSYLKQFNHEKFYYVHSFVAEPEENLNQIATSYYNGKKFCAITTKNSNIIGTQFHPEKSSNIGLDFFKSIINNSIN